MAFFKCSGGANPTGNATAADVKSGKTFSNADGTDLTGTFAAQEKTVTSSRSAQTVTPDSGKYLSKVTVNALTPTGTYKPTSRVNNNDMGATSNYRYVDTTSVPNTNSGTYTYASGSTGGTVDMGATNTYRYVNASNVYAKGKADGVAVLPSKNCYSGTGVITIPCKVGDIFLCVGYDNNTNLMHTCISGGTVYTANDFTNKTTNDLKSYYNGDFRLVVATSTTIKFQLPNGSTTFSGTVFALQK